jgi:hypothetical protein
MFLEDSAQIPSQRNRIPCICPEDEIFRPDTQLSKHHPSERENFSSGPSSVSRSFNLFQLASVRMFQQYFRMPLSVRSAIRFLSRSQIWEDSWNRSDDVDSCLDALIHKASRAFKIHTSGRQSSWSGPASFIYRNCVHQISSLDDRCLGPDAPNLDMKIACS